MLTTVNILSTPHWTTSNKIALYKTINQKFACSHLKGHHNNLLLGTFLYVFLQIIFLTSQLLILTFRCHFLPFTCKTTFPSSCSNLIISSDNHKYMVRYIICCINLIYIFFIICTLPYVENMKRK